MKRWIVLFLVMVCTVLAGCGQSESGDLQQGENMQYFFSGEVVEFHGQSFNKSDLSAETLEWLEWFNGLSETGQLSVSFVPQEILELCGYVSTENSEVSGPTD